MANIKIAEQHTMCQFYGTFGHFLKSGNIFVPVAGLNITFMCFGEILQRLQRRNTRLKENRKLIWSIFKSKVTL